MARTIRPRLLIVGGPDVDSRLELMDRLADDFELAAAGSEPRLAEPFHRRHPYFHYSLSRGFDLTADRRSVSDLQTLIARWAPDVVHCFDTKPSVVGRLAARRARVPVVLGTLPGLGALYSYDTPSIRQRREVFRRLHRLAGRFSQLTLFYNLEDLELFVERGIVAAPKSRVIDGSGVSAERFAGLSTRPDRRATARRRLGLGDNQPLVLAVGRLIRAKGPLDLAAAARTIRTAHPDCQIWWAGREDPEALDALDPAELARISREVKCLGPRSDLEDLLAAADVFVFPSFYREGIPRALIEAAFAGLPIVTTDNVGCREVVIDQHSGLLVPPRRPGPLARAVLDLLNDRQVAQSYGRSAGREARQRFELGRIAHQLRLIYHELLEP